VGGAITAGLADVTIIGSTFSDNAATGTATPGSGQDFGQGGAIEYSGCSGCQLSIASSTFTGNSATGDGSNDGGGAIAASGAVLIQNSSFSGNSTTGIGGAIRADSAGQAGITGSSTLLITASTFAANAAGQGDAIYNSTDSASLAGTIVAANGGGNCAGSAITDQGYNLEWTGSTNTSAGYSCFSAYTSIKGQDPKLGSLADNGGSTQTIALPAGSPGTDKIPIGTSFTASSTTYVLCPASATTDQRGAGYSRPDNGESSCDIGAYEAQDDPTLTTTATPSASSIGSSISDRATVSGGYSPTGTVTFNLYISPNGTGTPLFTDANEPLNSNGVATSKGYTATATGIDYWVATYSGDTNNNSVTSNTSGEPVAITYSWSGFLAPIIGSQVNVAAAGQSIPLQFSLGGNQGLSIFAPNYPASVGENCAGWSQLPDNPILTDTAGGSGLQYDPTSNTYTYVWKTAKSWSGSCRQLQVGLNDGTIHTVNVQFK
jgi:hypothetical protein